VAHLLKSLDLARLNKAVAIPGLNRDDVYRLKILIPDAEEQRRIAAILDQAEALRAKRRQALAKLDTLTQSLFLECLVILQSDEDIECSSVERNREWNLRLSSFHSRVDRMGSPMPQNPGFRCRVLGHGE
jgi:hypothetical protein